MQPQGPDECPLVVSPTGISFMVPFKMRMMMIMMT